jgi:hypothetical protein
VKSPARPHAELSSSSKRLLTLEILCLEDAVGNAVGSSQEILASPIVGSSVGTAMEMKSACKFHDFCKLWMRMRVSNLHAEEIQQAVVFLDLTSRGFLVGEITNGLEELCADATLACWLFLGVAAKKTYTSVYCCEVEKFWGMVGN